MKQIFLQKISLKHMVTEMSSQGNVWSRKCLSGEMRGQGSLHQGSVWSGNYLFSKMSIGEVSVREVSVRELSSGKCQSGKCPVAEMSIYCLKIFGCILVLHTHQIQRYTNADLKICQYFHLHMKIIC